MSAPVQIRRFSAQSSLEAITPVLNEEGVVIIERAVDASKMHSLMTDLEPHLAQRPIAGGEFFGGRCKRLHGLARLSMGCGDLLTHPQLLGLADAVLLENCMSYRVQVLSVLQVWGGGALQPLHRDTGVYQPYVACGPDTKPILLSFIWAVSDFTATNGATRIVPGSHRWPRDRTATAQEIAVAEMPQGSVVIYHGSILHGMGINQGEMPRTGLVSGFCVGWLRQEENQYLSCPEEVAKTLPVRVQQLLGYQAHSPILGWAEDRDPDQLLTTKADHDAKGYDHVEQDKQAV